MQKKNIFRLRFSRDEDVTGVAGHSEIELLYLLEGVLDIQVEQKLTHLEKEDILVINPDRRCSVQYADHPLLVHLLIDYNIVRDAMQGQDVLFWCDSTASEHDKYKELRKFLKRLIRRYISSENYESTFSFLADCYEILAFLCFDFVVKAADVQWNEEGDRFEERLFQINNYINSNYDQAISIKDLSEKLYLSIGYLSRFFKKNYGMNFASYLTNVRLVHAADELLYTNISITRVAYDCGFTSAAIFNKAFKKVYNITPTEFRKQAEGKEKTEADTILQADLEDRIGHILKAEDYVSDIREDQVLRSVGETYSVLDPSPLKNYWGDTINFGDAFNLLDSAVRKHFQALQETIHFRYVRFWSIFSKEFFIKPDQEQYDFSQIDSVLDYILEQGLKPYIELGLKPKSMHYEIGQMNRVKAGEIFTAEQWGKLFPRFMRHLENRYGKKALTGWRMELWADEDLRSDSRFWGSYLEKFRITYDAVKACNPSIELGGYGIRMDSGEDDRIRFLKLWKESVPLPDFISVMYYAYERGADGMDIHARRSTDEENFIHKLREEKERFRNVGFDYLPVYICEWNLTPSVRNFINDTCYKGAYVIQNILDVFGEVQSMGFGAGSDRQYSSFDTSGLLYGGTGLITKEGIRKPAAFALSFMNGLYPFLVGKHKNYIITTDGYHNYNIVCHNKQRLNENYYLTPETKIRKDSIWKYFDQLFRLKLQITLEDVENGVYKMNLFRVNNEFGSILKIWEGMSFEEDLSKEEILYLKKICEPHISMRKLEAEHGKLMISEVLEPNEIAFLTIRRV